MDLQSKYIGRKYNGRRVLYMKRFPKASEHLGGRATAMRALPPPLAFGSLCSRGGRWRPQRVLLPCRPTGLLFLQFKNCPHIHLFSLFTTLCYACCFTPWSCFMCLLPRRPPNGTGTEPAKWMAIVCCGFALLVLVIEQGVGPYFFR